MTDPLIALGRLALPLSYQVGLLVALAWAVAALSRQRLADFRYRLWLVVLGRLLVPVVLVSPLGPLDPEVPARLTEALAVGSLDLGGAGASPGEPAAASPKLATGTTSPLGSLPVIIALLWLAGAAAAALISVLRHHRLRREVDLAAPARGPLVEFVERQRRALSLATPVSVRVTPEAASFDGPALVGLTRPCIVVPHRFEDGWQEEVHGPLLLHELVHLKRRDGWINLVVAIVRVVYFFHPLVWLATTRLLRERERVCDDAVVRFYGSTSPYVRALCQHALAVTSSRQAAPRIALARSRSELIHRIQRLEARGYRLSRIPALPGLLLGAALVLSTSAEPTAASRAREASHVPEEVARLAGRLDRALSRPEGSQEAATLALLLVERHPLMPDEVATMVAIALDESELAPRGRTAWLSHLRSRRDDPLLLSNAAAFFEWQDPELAEALLERGRELEPGEWSWSDRLGRIRLRRAYRESPRQPRAILEAARRDFATALDLGPEGSDRVRLLGRASRAALATGRLDEADALAARQLVATEDIASSWDYGNALHQARLTRGEVALRRGDTAAAAEWLIAAADVRGSPQLDTFGPNMALAEELLRAGVSAPVLTYLESCRSFWKLDKGRLDAWSDEIRAGRIPDFGANKIYQLT